MDIQTDVEVGSIFAKDFRIQRRLRSGGMGSVFIVEQISTAKQRALKLLAPSLADHPDIRERFVREAQAASAIDSDHVVEIVCGGVDEASSTPFLVMELLRGEDLADRVERAGPMSLQDVERVVSQLGHALARAHAKGIVHRDLKPENVFLATSRRREDAFCTKILDFGVAKLINENSAEIGTLPVGSPAYMAPEQTDAYGNITAAADVWSLGLLAFFLIAGRSYWTAGEAGSVPALLREVCFEPIDAPSDRLQKLNCQAQFPLGFDDWFLRCVERDLEKRFASAEQAVAAYPLTPRVEEPRPGKPKDRKSNPEGLVLPARVATEAPSRLKRGVGAALGIALLAGGVGGLLAFVLTPNDRRTTTSVAARSDEDAELEMSTSGTGQSSVPLDITNDDADLLEDPQPRRPYPSARAPAAPTGSVLSTSSASTASASAATTASLSNNAPSGPCKGGGALENRVCIDRFEVTVAGYLGCVQTKTCAPLTGVVSYDGLRPDVAARYSALCNRDASQSNLPVNCVTYEAASTYCQWKGGALPTEQQWLEAARNHGTTPFPWGEEAPSELYLNACGQECEQWALNNALFVKRIFQGSDRYSTAAPVGSFPRGASKLGVEDLIGNVAEWTAPKTAGDLASVRGGSFLSNRPEQFVGPQQLKRSSSSHLVGFRCVTSAQ